MEEMSKKTKRLEKENLALSRKSETTNHNLLKMADERTRHHRDLDALKKKNTKLENLCRALQAERTTLENRLRGAAAAAEDADELLEDSEDPDSEEYEDSADGYDEDGSEDVSEPEPGEDTEEDPGLEEDVVVLQEAEGGKSKKASSVPATATQNGIRT